MIKTWRAIVIISRSNQIRSSSPVAWGKTKTPSWNGSWIDFLWGIITKRADWWFWDSTKIVEYNSKRTNWERVWMRTWENEGRTTFWDWEISSFSDFKIWERNSRNGKRKAITLKRSWGIAFKKRLKFINWSCLERNLRYWWMNFRFEKSSWANIKGILR